MTLELTTPTKTCIRIRRRFDAPVALVWRAHSEPALVRQWLTGPEGHTMPECEIDFRIGGTWRYVWAFPEGRMTATGTFREIIAEQRIVHTEVFDTSPESETLIETSFFADGSGTRLDMSIHYDSVETRDAVLRSPMEEGLEASYRHLDDLLPGLT